jgi:hypothetical protein
MFFYGEDDMSGHKPSKHAISVAELIALFSKAQNSEFDSITINVPTESGKTYHVRPAGPPLSDGSIPAKNTPVRRGWCEIVGSGGEKNLTIEGGYVGLHIAPSGGMCVKLVLDVNETVENTGLAPYVTAMSSDIKYGDCSISLVEITA